MAFKIIFLEEFGKAFVPRKIIPNLKGYMLKAGFSEVPYKLFGMLFYVSAFITTLIFITFIFPYISAGKYSILLVYLYSFGSWFVVQLFFAVFFIMVVYFYLDLRIYHRTRLMEEQLPDFLEVVSANLKGGMTFERALWGAINPRFKVLSNEMARTSKKVMTGYDLSKALIELGGNYDSLMLKRTMDLIISEVESGGNVAELIDRLVDNLKETKELKDEMAASAIAYMIFISIIVVVISPLLFALSFHLLKILVGFVNKLSATTQNVRALPFVFSKISVNVEDFRKFSMIALFVISLFSSLIVAIVEKGQIKAGIKYIPIYVIGSTFFYFIFMKVLGSVLGGIV